MNELKELLNEIIKEYNGELSNDEKYSRVTLLWEKYYELKNSLNVDLDDDYNLLLMFENDCYRIEQKPTIEEPDKELVVESLKHLDEAKSNNVGIDEAEAKNILDYVLYYTRRNFTYLGVDIKKHSMNGFCELAQSLSIRPFEDLGLKVTKNLAENDFGYMEHHAFGTVTFPINENGRVVDRTYLIDPTYRQFFTSTRCHEGMYYIKDKDTNKYKKPDPGYFVENIEFAKELMSRGYIELNSENAKTYGSAFSQASSIDISKINYYENIVNSTSDYVLSEKEMEGLSVDFPEYKHYKK